jgi:hypothetical protein
MALNDEDGPEIIELLMGVANNPVDELITRPAATRTFGRGWNASIPHVGGPVRARC